MINKLSIANYQSHKHSILNFHSGVNLIIGTSDSGKSAVIRALRFAISNKPRGDGFMSWWGGETAVEIECSDCLVLRTKTNSENVYLLNDKTDFRAFGTEVPEEISKALNLDEAVNIQKQIDQPYLISETPGAVAQHFNRMAQLEKIDIGLKNVQSQIRSSEQSIKAKREELVNRRNQLDDYKYITEAEEKVQTLEQKELRIAIISKEVNSITSIISKLLSIDSQIKRAEKPLKAEPAVLQLIKLSESINTKENKIGALQRLKTSIETLENKIEKGGKFIKAEKKVITILGKSKVVEEKSIKYDALYNILDKEESIRLKISKEQKTLKENEKIWDENQPEVCPLCNHHKN